MKIAYAQMKVAAGHPDINTEKILKFIGAARDGGADVVIFPKAAVSGQMLGDAKFAESFRNDYENFVQRIATQTENITVIYEGLLITNRDIPQKYTFLEPRHLEFKAKGKIYRVHYIFDVFSGEEVSSGDSDFCINFSSKPFNIRKAIELKPYDCPVIQIGNVGVQNTGKTIYTFDGGSAVFNARGEIVQLAESFAECLNFVELEEIDKMPALKLPKVSEVEKIYQAISYGVKTFLEQIGMKKVVIGISGGIDSAVAAALYTKILGEKNIYLVNMPSKFNSATTKSLSEQLAKNLGCKYYVIPIQESVDLTVKQLNKCGIEVSNFVKENIQARDRSSRILAAVAASLGGVFTCNANKAETTVGYATLYGDEAGFLSALADLWKHQVYALARYMNEKIYRREVIPQGIIDIVPSAELSTEQNVDEGKGDPLKYPYHDYLFRAFAEMNLTPEEILIWYTGGELEKNIGCEEGIVEKYFPSAQEFITDLEYWWKQFNVMGIAKRIQSPPILAVTDSPYGANYESQNGCHFTKKYFEVKNSLLARQRS